VGVDEVWCGGVSAWWVVLRIGGPLVVMDGSGSCAGVISAMGGYEVELCGGGGFTWRMRADGVVCVVCGEFVLQSGFGVCVWGLSWEAGGGGGGGHDDNGGGGVFELRWWWQC
jgi:hypothetical protein